MILQEPKSQDLLRTITLIVCGRSFCYNEALGTILEQLSYGGL